MKEENIILTKKTQPMETYPEMTQGKYKKAVKNISYIQEVRRLTDMEDMKTQIYKV